jgi:hypothetical protein
MPSRFETDDLNVARFRIMKISRTALEASRRFAQLPMDHPKAAEIAHMDRACRSVIMATRPCVVSRATFPECMAVLAFKLAATSGERAKLN